MESKSGNHEAFAALSDEYAQALEALRTIEREAELLVAAGSHDELRQVISRFQDLANRAIAQARAGGQEHFPEWFEELLERLHRLEKRTLV